MPKTPVPIVLQSLATWVIPMVLPVLMLYFRSNVRFNIIMLTFVFPMVLTFVSRTARFWVSRGSVAFASLISIGVSYLLTLNKNAKEYLENPDEHKVWSAMLYSFIIFVFLFAMGIFGHYDGLFNPKNVEKI